MLKKVVIGCLLSNWMRALGEGSPCLLRPRAGGRPARGGSRWACCLFTGELLPFWRVPAEL